MLASTAAVLSLERPIRLQPVVEPIHIVAPTAAVVRPAAAVDQVVQDLAAADRQDPVDRVVRQDPVDRVVHQDLVDLAVEDTTEVGTNPLPSSF